MGITKAPQFSWILASGGRNVKQVSYRLAIGRDEEMDKLVYDSGRIVSEESAHVVPEGFRPESATKYFVRVWAEDNRGEKAQSGAAWFVTGIVDNDHWKGDFISAETPEDKDRSEGTYVRGVIRVPKKIESAYAYTTALGLYQFYINGRRVGEDELTPGWTSYHKHLLYQTYDVTGFLKPGANAVGALVGAGWYKGLMGFEGFRNNYGDRTAFLCQLEVAYEDGTRETFATDGSFRGSRSPVLFSEIYDGESYDARMEADGWCRPEYDDGGWEPVRTVPYDKSALTAQTGARVGEITKVPAVTVMNTPKGERVVDFGQNMAGWIHFRVRAKEGARVRLVCFETLDREGNVYLANLRKAAQTIEYICRDDREVWFHPHFTFQGFRYALIAEYPGKPEPADFCAYAVHSRMEPTGSFRCSHPLVNQLQHNIEWGMKSNFVDVPTDCPQRNERMGWTGDAQIFCRTASYLMNTYTFFRKWLKDVAADQTPEGGVPHMVPDIVSDKQPKTDWLLSQGTHSAAAWADAAVINPWTLYLTFGDQEILREQYDSMKAWVGFMEKHADNGIWNYQLQFGDWVALDAEEGSYFGATPNDLTCTAYYAYSTGLLAKTAQALGQDEDAARYRKLYEEIRRVFQNTFFNKDGSMTAMTQTAHIVALMFELTPERFVGITVENLLRLLEKEDGHLVTGFVGTPYFCHVLSRYGHTKEAYELLLKEDFPSWLYQVRMGATTVWEHWDGIRPDGTMWSPDMNSLNHYAYGAVGEWLYRVAAGIEIDEKAPGYRHFYLYPHVGGGLSYVEASYRSVYGRIRSRWETEGDRLRMDITVPVNTAATLVVEEEYETAKTDGLEFRKKKGRWTADCGSGEYHLEFIKN